MNKQITALTIALSAFVGLQQAASAQEGHEAPPRMQARFDYAPNVWKGEEPNKPRVRSTWVPSMAAPTMTVPAGSVPKNMLGLMPGDIPVRVAPRVAPIVHTAVTPSASFVSAVPVQIPTAFNQAFGHGLSAQPKAPLSVPPAATARPAPGNSHAAHPNRPPVIAHSVSGRMVKPHLPVGHAAGPANGLPPVASYGNQGYTPGAFLPSVGGSGASSSANLSGKLISHRH